MFSTEHQQAFLSFGSPRSGTWDKPSYMFLMFVLYVICAVLLLLDRFKFENLEVSERIGDMKAVLDSCFPINSTDLNSGSIPFSVYGVIVKATGRLIIVSVFFLLMLNLKRFWLNSRDSFIGRFYINFSSQKDVEIFKIILNRLLMALIFIHMFSIFVPITLDRLHPKIMRLAEIDDFLNKASNGQVSCETVPMLSDDIYRMVIYFLLLIPVLFVSTRLMRNEGEASYPYTVGRWLYHFFLLYISFELIRRQDYSTARFMILPALLLYVFDMILVECFWRETIQVKTYKVSEKYMLLFWSDIRSEKHNTELAAKDMDSISKLNKFEISQYQSQLPYDLIHDLGGEYGSRTTLGFANHGNMFSLGLAETVADENYDPETSPLAKTRLLECEEGVLKLNFPFIRKSRRRQRVARLRNKKLLETFGQTPPEPKLTPNRMFRPKFKLSSSFVDFGKGFRSIIGSSYAGQENKSEVDDDSVELGVRTSFRGVEEHRDDDLGEEDPIALALGAPSNQFFDRAVLMKLEPMFDDEFEGSHFIRPPTFENMATVEQLNDYTNPIKISFYGSFSTGDIDYALQAGRDVICFATGGGAIFLLDLLRYIVHHQLWHCRVSLLYSTPDFNLLQWFVECVDEIFYSSPYELGNIKILVGLTAGDLARHGVAKIAVDSAFGFEAGRGSHAAHPGSEFDDEAEEPTNVSEVATSNLARSTRRVLEKISPIAKQNTRASLGNRARGSRNTHRTREEASQPGPVRSNKRKCIRFRWGKVVLGRLNVEEKFKKLKKLGFDCVVCYQGGSSELENVIEKNCRENGFEYLGLHSYEALQSMSMESPRMQRIVEAIESMVNVGRNNKERERQGTTRHSAQIRTTGGVSQFSRRRDQEKAKRLRESGVGGRTTL